jgi:uncharacterized LabA/DUF88 family protein
VISLFVDISRNYRAVTNIDPKARINYKRYLEIAVGDERLHKAYAYGVQKDGEAEDFATALRFLGYETKYRQARIVSGQPSIHQTSMSLVMTMDIVRSVKIAHTVIIGSNDPELYPVIEWLKEQGIKVILFSKNIPYPLKDICDRCMDITKELLDYKEE